MDKYTIATKKIITKIQRKYKNTKANISYLNDKFLFQKNYLLGMTHNLAYLNNYKIYQDTDLFNILLRELKIIKDNIDKLDKYPLTYNNITTKELKNYFKLYNDNKLLLIKYSNHIAINNINYLFTLLISDKWNNYFMDSEKEIIQFLENHLIINSVWDSDYHSLEVEYLPSENTKPANINKEILEDLLEVNKRDSIKVSSIIINPITIKLPIFISPMNKEKQLNHFSKMDCRNILQNDNIKITKNYRSETLINDKIGVMIYLRIRTIPIKYIVIQGIFKDDLLDMAKNYSFIKDIINNHQKILNNDINIPNNFKQNYLNIIGIRNLIVSSSSEILDEIKKKHNDFKTIQSKPLLTLVNEFLLASRYRKIDILTLLLISNDDDKKVAVILFDIFKSKDKKDVSTEIYQMLHPSIRDLLDNTKKIIDNEETELTKLAESDIPYEKRISLLKVSEDVKGKAMDKLKSIKSSFQGDSKAQSWLDGLLKIPFGIYSQNDIMTFKERFINKLKVIDNSLEIYSDNDITNYLISTSSPLLEEWNNYSNDKREYLKSVRTILDSAVYGHKEAKLQLERLFAQWINGEAKGAVLGLQGPPGTGKTSLAKNGISKCLKDKNNLPRPFNFIPIGGSVNGSTLIGHSFTYLGSTWGRIVDILMVSGCMNPIIFIDEIDKVSHTEQGREIISILTHLTDSTQNDEFEDKFFAGIKIDLSKALIIFSFNDPELIDPILKDRITIIETHSYSINEKIIIIKNYMLPEICKDVGFNPNEIIFSDEIIRYIINTYTHEAGVRKIKEKIVEIVRDINLQRFYNNECSLPFIVTQEYINKLFENKRKLKIKTIAPEPLIGLVNGLYATSSGIGGLTVIQLTRFPSSKMLDIQLTGKAGDVMKESVQYSLKVAWSLLSIDLQNEMIENSNNKKSFGIHVHCPDGATPKDGPSAGAAFTLAIYSLLTNQKINNKVCMTGEIDLLGNITAIGGVESKLNGGKKAGCTLALIPEDNLEDLERLRRENISPEDDNFKVLTVSHIKEVITYAIIDLK